MDKQTVIDACEANFEANKTDCNAFVKAVANSLGVAGLSGDADSITGQIQTGIWTPLTTGTDAKAKADAGYFVVAGIKGANYTPPEAHGHVVVVVSGPLAAVGPYPTAYWGKLGSIGKKNTTLNFAFNEDSRDDVVYGFCNY